MFIAESPVAVGMMANKIPFSEMNDINMGGQCLFDQVDRFPVAFLVVHRIDVGRCHFGAAGFHEADVEPAFGEDIGGGVFLGDAHRIGA